MAEEQNPTTETEPDISEAQSQQEPPAQAHQEQEGEVQDDQPSSEAEQIETAEAADQPDEGLEGDTLTQQRTDVEGTTQEEKGEAEAGFVGAEGQQDTSSELVEDQDFDEGGESAP